MCTKSTRFAAVGMSEPVEYPGVPTNRCEAEVVQKFPNYSGGWFRFFSTFYTPATCSGVLVDILEKLPLEDAIRAMVANSCPILVIPLRSVPMPSVSLCGFPWKQHMWPYSHREKGHPGLARPAPPPQMSIHRKSADLLSRKPYFLRTSQHQLTSVQALDR